MKAPILDPRIDERLTEAELRFAGIGEALANPEVLSNPDNLRDLGKERSRLEPIVTTGRQLRSALAEHQGAVELLAESDDPEMKALAEEEVAEQSGRIEHLSARLKELLIPSDPLDDAHRFAELGAGSAHGRRCNFQR